MKRVKLTYVGKLRVRENRQIVSTMVNIQFNSFIVDPSSSV